jgi:S-adenosyl-l-methionine hydroxide adenosyltransferase
MIVLFTDFGLHGPYTGQMKAVLHQMAPSTPVIDLFSDAPIGNPKASAYLLASYAAWFSAGCEIMMGNGRGDDHDKARLSSVGPVPVVAKIAKPTESKQVKGPAESGEICSVEVEEK